ncbi:ABC transporter permease [Tissierella pigra]|uniref:ABC transporter permease n=1 Tax=Tissierella pigra TaxID=2607614 RepID=A0A6N7XW57_9FIRM|nr:ABC-2 family transporter protein [Tissierella pigra]MBU5426109.1 ABC transporter permease [Tissierella pigra]MSU00774.1 hypothetical protein [Tissierella pigra]
MNFKIYKNLLYQSFSEMMSHRFTSICIIIFGIMFIGIEFIAGYVYFQFSDLLLGWSRDDYFLLISSFNIITYGYQFFFILSHEILSESIIEGELDYILIRPLNSFFFYSLYRVDIPSIIGLIISIITFSFFLPIRLGLLEIVIVFLMFVLNIVFVFLINHIVVITSFWSEKSEKLLALPEYIMDFSARPRNFYPRGIKFIFSIIIPSFIATNSIVDFIRKEFNILEYIWFLIFIFILGILSYYFWNKGLEKYQSAN